MRIIRFSDAEGNVGHAAEQAVGKHLRIEGDLYGDFQVTNQAAAVHKLLAPIEPSSMICIGLNYRQHAAQAYTEIRVRLRRNRRRN